MNITLVVPSGISGGVRTVYRNLLKGLINEGIQISIHRLRRGRFPLLSTLYSDAVNARFMRSSDLVLILGSIPWPSHIIAGILKVPVALFLHGFVTYELTNELFSAAGWKNRMGAGVHLAMFKIGTTIGTVNFYICHSLTTCEYNGISDNFVLLPQWILPEELEYFNQYRYNIPGIWDNGLIRIVAYTSRAFSPRLLRANHLIQLARIIERKVNRKFEIIIVNPRGETTHSGPVKIVEPMVKSRFLSLLSAADLYIETCIDEELRLTTIEAMTLGVPVAKLTHPEYLNRQDYEEYLINASSFNELADRIAEYINKIDYYYQYYSGLGRKFALEKRTWDAVKGPFLSALRQALS